MPDDGNGRLLVFDGVCYCFDGTLWCFMDIVSICWRILVIDGDCSSVMMFVDV